MFPTFFISFLVIISTTQIHDFPTVKGFQKRLCFLGMSLQAVLDERS
jgi:hypothetical protein